MDKTKIILGLLFFILPHFCIKYQDFLFTNAKELIIPLTPKPNVSVIISSYNMGKSITQAIDSIINQTYKDWEVIVIDDGSFDKTQKTLRKYRGNFKVRIIRNPVNIGLPNSLNKGLKRARGKYIARLDADDTSYPDRLERELAFLEKENLDLVAHTFHYKDSPNVFFDENLDTYDIGLNLLMHNRFCHSSVMMKREFLQKHKLTYSNDFKNAEDYELWVKIFLNRGKIGFIGGAPLIIYNPSSHSKEWFNIQYTSRDLIRTYGISEIIPDFDPKMLKMSLCELMPLYIEGNKTTKILDQSELIRYNKEKCPQK